MERQRSCPKDDIKKCELSYKTSKDMLKTLPASSLTANHIYKNSLIYNDNRMRIDDVQTMNILQKVGLTLIDHGSGSVEEGLRYH